MKKGIIIVFTSLLCLAGCNKQAGFDERCAREAKEQTLRLCPQKMAEGIMLDSVSYQKKGRMFEYYYTMDDSLYSQQIIDQAKGKLREGLRKGIVNSIELKKYKENDIAFRYVYIGKVSRKPVLEFTFTSESYKDGK